MTKSNVIAMMALLALAAPRGAGAQMLEQAGATDARPLEIGGGLGTVGSWWTGPVSGGDLRVGVPISQSRRPRGGGGVLRKRRRGRNANRILRRPIQAGFSPAAG